MKASTIFAIFFIALRIIQLGTTAHAHTHAGYTFANVHNSDEQVIDTIDLGLKIGFAVNGFFLLIDICLLIGTLKKIVILLWVWLIVAGISLVYVLISNIMRFIILNFIVSALTVLVTIWTMLAVYGSIQEIKEEE